MTLQEAKSIARRLGLTLRKVRSGEYRVNFRDGNETSAYYTDNLEDAVKTAIEMARRRVVTKVCAENSDHRDCAAAEARHRAAIHNYRNRGSPANGAPWAGWGSGYRSSD